MYGGTSTVKGCGYSPDSKVVSGCALERKYSLGECRKNSGREYDPVYIQIRSIISVTEKDGGNRGKGNK